MQGFEGYTELLPNHMSDDGEFVWLANDLASLGDARKELSWVRIWRSSTPTAEGDGPYKIEELIADNRIIEENDVRTVVLRLRSKSGEIEEVPLGSIRNIVIFGLHYEG